MSTGLLFNFPRVAPLYQGAVQPGSKLYFYVTSTTTPTDTYTTKALSVANANPVVADSAGSFAEIWLDPAVTYRVTWKDANDVQLTQTDDVNVLVSDFARQSQSNTFVGQQSISVTSGTAALQMESPSGTKLKLYGDTGGIAFINARNAGDSADAAMQIQASTLALVSTTITANGVNVTDFARLSQENTFAANQLISHNSSPQFTLTDADNSTSLFLQAAGGSDGRVGTSTNHSLSLYANNSPYLVISGSGNFDFKGGEADNFEVKSITAASLASAANAINTTGKTAGKMVLDSTNHKLYTARGANATDPWDLADGSASVTPS